MKTWAGCICLVVAVFMGAAVFSGLRTWYYIHSGLTPNMAPQMFIIFSPVLAAPISFLALLIHIIFRRFFQLDAYWKWFLAGISYSSVLLGLITPWLFLIPLIFNPINYRLFFYRKRKTDWRDNNQ
jgi:hypothetical protein